MTCFLIHCKDYRCVRVVTVKSFDELPKLCREEEIKLSGDGDGYAVYATHDGRHVAYAEGLTDEWQPDPVYQSGLAYACGYRRLNTRRL